ncbi:MAG TPA: flagellar motor protein MotB [Terriglobales bacterium]|nr:flagellar motor protein MotB [Terriglobales bacterium]
MRRRKRTSAPPPHRDRWLVSYADFITLLFAFFVVMYSAAQLDKRRAGQLATAIQTAFLQSGSLPPAPSDLGGGTGRSSSAVADQDQTALTNQIEHTLAGEIASGSVAVRDSAEGLVISLREVGFFDTGSDKIKDSSVPAFAQLAQILQQNGSSIRIEGHTDDVPIHNPRFSSNWDLSTARATATIRLLIRYGLRPARMAASGYAEYHPIASNATPQGRALNRRVDIVVPRKQPQS